MPYPRLTTAIAFLSAALCCTAPALADDSWIEVHSAHFSVVTDAGDKRGRDVAERFEQMRSIFGALFSKQKVNIPVPLQIIAFRNGKEMRQYVPLWHGKPIEVAGLYQMGEDRNFILLDMSVEDPYPTVFHEYAHLLLNGNYPPTQPWFDEGFAEFFSSIKITHKETEIGHAPEGEVDTLRDSRLMPILDLFRVRQDSSTYNESGDHRSLFYAESWLVMHYIFDHRLLVDSGKYFTLVQDQHLTVADAMQQGFGMDPKNFDKTIRAYLAEGRISIWPMPTPLTEPTTYEMHKMKPGDFQAVLADAHLHSPDYRDRAISEFEQILAHDPDNAAAHRGLGYGYLFKKDYAKAGEHFRRAVALNSQDPRVLYYSALLQTLAAQAAHSTQLDLNSMRTDLQKSISLDPTNADAQDLLAYVQMQQGSPSAAVESEKQALKIKPREERFMMNYAQYQLAAHNIDEAEAVFQRLESSQNPAIAAAAQSNLQIAQTMKQSGSRVEIRPYNEKQWGTNARPVPASTSTENDEEPETPAAVAVQEEAPAKPDMRPISYLKGKIIGVDCSAKPAATITIQSASKKWQMCTADSSRLVLLGADAFSCQWKNQKVSVNYHDEGNSSGDLVSLEIQ